MDRREILKVMALTFGGSLALPESAFAKLAEPFDPSKLTFFTKPQRELVAVLAETIIPKTDTPGAIDAGVPALIELIAQDCLPESDQKVILEGLGTVETHAADQSKKPFAQLATAERITLLTAMENEAKQAGNTKAFIRQFKDLTKFCFVNSEIGATQAFEFTLVPGRWDAAMDLKPGQKAYSI
ncbi:gluconate 2-dehydrogenase subunit 3 family protein [Luteolibacter soli]|uniref:Gluconate 2-dehydrogenase subunit 3 family protein n=1 Tax=Luteolibacter soli TaxID=3135280 RepID=A0ABU9AZ17_9BACT